MGQAGRTVAIVEAGMIGEVRRPAAIRARATLMEAGQHMICEKPLGIGMLGSAESRQWEQVED